MTKTISKIAMFAIAELVLGAAQYAAAQGPVQTCSARMTALLDVKFNGDHANECQVWTQGLGDGQPGSSHTRSRIPPAGGAACSPGEILNFAKGQLVIEEPTNAVCDPVADGGCPALFLGDGALSDPANRSVAEVSARNILAGGALIITSSIVASFEGSTFTRFGCADNPPAGVDPSECGAPTPAKTYLVVDDSVRHCQGIGAAGDSPPQVCATDADCGGAPGSCDATGLVFKYNQQGDSVATGDALCCDSITDTLCQGVFLFAEYPNPNRPVPQVQDRLGSPPFVFEGGRGSRARTSETFVVPGQSQGQCTDGPTFTPCQNDGQCPAGTVCDFADKGFRIAESTLLPDTGPNPSACSVSVGVLILEPVDAVTGRSTKCGHSSFFPVGTEGDPLPTCLAKVQGSFTRPDLDCDGVEDDTNGDGQPGPDLCPFFAEVDHFADTNLDTIGDECQCGDVNRDGAISGPDIGGTALCANGAILCDPGQADADGDNATTALDIAGVVAVVNGNAATSALQCARNP